MNNNNKDIFSKKDDNPDYTISPSIKYFQSPISPNLQSLKTKIPNLNDLISDMFYAYSSLNLDISILDKGLLTDWEEKGNRPKWMFILFNVYLNILEKGNCYVDRSIIDMVVKKSGVFYPKLLGDALIESIENKQKIIIEAVKRSKGFLLRNFTHPKANEIADGYLLQCVKHNLGYVEVMYSWGEVVKIVTYLGPDKHDDYFIPEWISSIIYP